MLDISTADINETWSITEAVDNLQATPQKSNEWLVAFKEGVELEDKVVYDTFGEQNEEDFIARYDLSFLTPRSQSIRCKVSFLDLRFLFLISFFIASVSKADASTKLFFSLCTYSPVRSSPERAIWVRALAGDIVL